MTYVAWADGSLTADEIWKIGEMMEAEPWFGDEAGSGPRVVGPRLAPFARPATSLADRHPMARTEHSRSQAHSLAALGVALVGEIDDPKVALWSSAEAAEALREPQSTEGGW